MGNTCISCYWNDVMWNTHESSKKCDTCGSGTCAAHSFGLSKASIEELISKGIIPGTGDARAIANCRIAWYIGEDLAITEPDELISVDTFSEMMSLIERGLQACVTHGVMEDIIVLLATISIHRHYYHVPPSDNCLSVLRLAASEGHPHAYYELGEYYSAQYMSVTDEYYEGDEQDVYNYTEASKRRHGLATYRLGCLYSRKNWVRRDLGVARSLFERAIALGCPYGHYGISRLHGIQIGNETHMKDRREEVKRRRLATYITYTRIGLHCGV